MYETLGRDCASVAIANDKGTGADGEEQRGPGMRQASAKSVVQFLERLQETGGLKGTDIANFAGVSKATCPDGAAVRSRPKHRRN